LVPTDDGVEHKNTDNDTEIDPITKTGSDEDSNFHDYEKELVRWMAAQWYARLCRHTVKNGTLEVRKKLEEHVLLLGSEFVVTGLLATHLDFAVGKTLPHVGVHPLLGSLEAIDTWATIHGLSLLPELPGRRVGRLSVAF